MTDDNTTYQKAIKIIKAVGANQSEQAAWHAIQSYLLSEPDYAKDFALHLAIYQTIYPNWRTTPAPAWFPDDQRVAQANLTTWLKTLNFADYQALHQWSHENYADFWQRSIKQLNIQFQQPYSEIANTDEGIENVKWLPNAKMNIATSCFNAKPNATAIIQKTASGLQKISYAELDRTSNQIANSLKEFGLQPGDAVGINMLMNADAVAIYLGIVKAGCVVVSIADSFAANEVQARLEIAKAKAIFVHDIISRGNKTLPLYEKIISPDLPPAIVLPRETTLQVTLRENDIAWDKFLKAKTDFVAVACNAGDYTNILFSSGTTGTPKAIPWTHTTPIKAATDAYFHQDIHPDDVLCWPTNLGWMMGPWLIYASLINHATIALYDDAPTTAEFGRFIVDAKVTMLGVIPSIIKTWRTSKCMETFSWQQLKTFSSTGECSNPEDMFYLMFLAGYKPIMEYCGGTEIGGAYITSTVLAENVPSLLTTPTMGLDFAIVDADGQQSDEGEVVLIPPSIGLSTTLLNRDHYTEYFAEVKGWQPGLILRRHGDKIKRLSNNMQNIYYRLEGRADDTMNLGGIKTSAVEIERVLNRLPNIQETAAIAVAAIEGGPKELIVYTVLQNTGAVDNNELRTTLQQAIKDTLNPLFKIAELILVSQLPKTASNKIMRKKLRADYQGKTT